MHATLILLLLLLVVACWFDWRERRIPNGLIVSGMVAFAVAAMIDGGVAALLNAFAGFLAGLLVLLPFFALRLVGAGDVKLMAVVGGFTGAKALLPIVLYTFIAGGLLAVVALIATRRGDRLLANFKLLFLSMASRAGGVAVSSADLGVRTAYRLPYALAIAFGVLAWLLTRS